jgi:dephospho-CoA kinase
MRSGPGRFRARQGLDSHIPPRGHSRRSPATLTTVRALRVGLTGGIGAGKSEVARRLASYGAVVIDADAVAREVVEPGTPGLAEVIAEFGPEVVRPDGTLDRERLGEIVFADEALRRKLNAITHPRVGERMRELEQAAGEAAIIIHDVPLLAENHLAGSFDLVVVVDVPVRTQAERLMRERGMSKPWAEARMQAQASREERLAIATIVVDNSGSLAELDREVGELWAELRRRALAAAG